MIYESSEDYLEWSNKNKNKTKLKWEMLKYHIEGQDYSDEWWSVMIIPTIMMISDNDDGDNDKWK